MIWEGDSVDERDRRHSDLLAGTLQAVRRVMPRVTMEPGAHAEAIRGALDAVTAAADRCASSHRTNARFPGTIPTSVLAAEKEAVLERVARLEEAVQAHLGGAPDPANAQRPT